MNSSLFRLTIIKKLKNRSLSLNVIRIPCIGYELADKDNSYDCFYEYGIEILKLFKEALETSCHHINLSADATGVECVAAMKNDYDPVVLPDIELFEKEAPPLLLHIDDVTDNNSKADIPREIFESITRQISTIRGTFIT